MFDRTIRNNIYQLFISSISRFLTLFLVSFLYCTVAQAREAESSAVMARIGDTVITRSQLDAESDEELWEERQSLYESRVEYLNTMVDKALLNQEARARGISVEQLLELELDQKITPVPDAIVKAINKAYFDDYPDLDDAGIQDIRDTLQREQKTALMQALVEDLRTRYVVEINMPAPVRQYKLYETGTFGIESLGPETAPFTLLFLYDLDCALCGEAIPALKEVMGHYEGRLRTIFRYAYGLPNEDERRADAASLCAGAQGHFIDFHQVLYDMDGDYPEDELLYLARELDLDMAVFKHCIIQNNWEFRDNYPAGSGDIELNISGTPTYFINGLKHTGLLSAGELASLIEREQ